MAKILLDTLLFIVIPVTVAFTLTEGRTDLSQKVTGTRTGVMDINYKQPCGELENCNRSNLPFNISSDTDQTASQRSWNKSRDSLRTSADQLSNKKTTAELVGPSPRHYAYPGQAIHINDYDLILFFRTWFYRISVGFRRILDEIFSALMATLFFPLTF